MKKLIALLGCGILEAVTGKIVEDAIDDIAVDVMEEVFGSDLRDVMDEMVADSIDEFFQDNGNGSAAGDIFGEYSDEFQEGFYEFADERGEGIAEDSVSSIFGIIGDLLAP